MSIRIRSFANPVTLTQVPNKGNKIYAAYEFTTGVLSIDTLTLPGLGSLTGQGFTIDPKSVQSVLNFNPLRSVQVSLVAQFSNTQIDQGPAGLFYICIDNFNEIFVSEVNRPSVGATAATINVSKSFVVPIESASQSAVTFFYTGALGNAQPDTSALTAFVTLYDYDIYPISL